MLTALKKTRASVLPRLAAQLHVAVNKTTKPMTMPPKEKLVFGQQMADHMLLRSWKDGEGYVRTARPHGDREEHRCFAFVRRAHGLPPGFPLRRSALYLSTGSCAVHWGIGARAGGAIARANRERLLTVRSRLPRPQVEGCAH